MMKNILNYSYYPGCSLHASAKEYDESTRELFKALKIGLTEVPDWLCCGATPAHNVDELLSLSLCAKNLNLADKVDGDLAVACAACFSRLKTTQHAWARTTPSASRWSTPSTPPSHWTSRSSICWRSWPRTMGLERLAGR